jgi:hypothetical protein
MERTFKDEIMALGVFLRNYKENHEILSQHSQGPGKDSNP